MFSQQNSSNLYAFPHLHKQYLTRENSKNLKTNNNKKMYLLYKFWFLKQISVIQHLWQELLNDLSVELFADHYSCMVTHTYTYSYTHIHNMRRK